VKFIILIMLMVSFVLGDRVLKVANYNVENLFDLKKSGYEYKEFIPYTKSNWNNKTYNIKLKNIARVIKDINADIIGLEEIESLQALKDLRYRLKRDNLYYPYYKIANKKNTTIKVAILSKIPFVYTREISVTSSYRYRNILEAKFKINNQNLYIFLNHWKAKSGPESMRIVSAKKLLKRIQQIGEDKNIIIIGDFNSDYEEYKKFKRKRKLNDTGGKTGINNVLHTIYQTNKASNTTYKKNSFYNLWYDTKPANRYSYKYRGKKEAMDNILISQSLLIKHGIYYKPNTIMSYRAKYLLKGKHIYRWQMSRKKPYKNIGKGFSDHLGVMADFIIQ